MLSQGLSWTPRRFGLNLEISDYSSLLESRAALDNGLCLEMTGLLQLMQVFMNVATGGFGTEITAQTDEGLKDKLGGAAYLLTGI